MNERLKNLYEEIVLTLRDNASRQSVELDPVAFAEGEVARWLDSRENDDGIWLSILVQLLRHGFPRYDYDHANLPVIREHLGDMARLAEMEDKDKKALVEIEELGLNLQRIRSIAKNARTAVMLKEDFGSLQDLVASFESGDDLAAGLEEMFSYIKGDAGLQFAREMGYRKPGSNPAVRRVLSRLDGLVDGSLDLEGIRQAIDDMAEAVGRDPEEIDYLLEIFADGEKQVGYQAVCNVNFACYRCRVSDSQCAERRFEFGSAREIERSVEE